LAFDVQGLRLIIVVVQGGAVKIYVASVEEALMKKERQDETQFTTKIGGSQLFHFVKFSFPVMCLMAYYAETDCSRPLIVRL